MAELRIALTAAGLVDVRTYIQSGNVIAGSQLQPSEIDRLVHEAILRQIGADLAIITRTPQQVSDILKGIPFSTVDSARLYFSMLSSPPAPDFLEKFLEIDFSPDEVKVVDDTIYTLYATKLSDSRFNNNYFERKLKVVATTRNFNTMSKLIELSTERSC
jgi:uncharacterized protein (DUF1697 family)